ncbi:unnamed protein product [Rotaria socialis]|uniref:Cyclic nucleotide-binding domain-containing protein n=1 Tax=Rotaria socialis TaxID=392032 RepID=A0A821EFM7_9BILA|nr:unnamed protein product [Rotaria socialis]CAF4635024.1 unnamed protein product [Rotaria socialis]
MNAIGEHDDETNQHMPGTEYRVEELMKGLQNIDEWKEFLLSVQMFHHIEDVQRYDIACQVTYVEFNHEQEIIIQGSAIVHQKALHDKSVIELSKIGKEDYFGGKSLLFNQKHVATVKANDIPMG